MEAIRHRVGVEAPLATVYEQLATIDGLASWWTTHTTGKADVVGDEIEFWFGGTEPSAVMEVVTLTPGERVAWKCVKGPDDWLDTTVTFDLYEHEGESVVLFTHADWREPVEFMRHCSMRWAYFLMSLKAGVERGAATPWPHDTKIDRWG